MKPETSQYEGPATILGPENEQLSTGRAHFDASGEAGKYEPSAPFLATAGAPSITLMLLLETGKTYRLIHFDSSYHEGETRPYPHHHFRVD